MFKENTFQIALVVSFIAHTLVLWNLPNFNIDPLKKSMQELDITYQDFKIPKALLEQMEQAQKSEPLQKNTAEFHKITVEKEGVRLPKQIAGPIFPTKKDFSASKPQLIDKISITKKITIPPTKADIKNPSYLTYDKEIREKIREALIRNFTKIRNGEVMVACILLKDGNLGQIQILDEESSNDDYLKQITVKSLKEASPFPAFPINLNYPELSFSVLISFEIPD